MECFLGNYQFLILFRGEFYNFVHNPIKVFSVMKCQKQAYKDQEVRECEVTFYSSCTVVHKLQPDKGS